MKIILIHPHWALSEKIKKDLYNIRIFQYYNKNKGRNPYVCKYMGFFNFI